MITTVLFDFYGVFQPDVYDAWLKRNGLTRTGPYLTIVKQLDSGKINREEFIDQLSQQLGRPVTYEEIYNDHELNTKTVDIARQLKQKYKLGLLSNASASLREKLAQQNLVDLFDQIIISSEVGVAKPDSQIYHLALKKLAAAPQDILYIDDNSKYIEAGNAIGMNTILFTSADLLQSALEQQALI